MTQRKIVNGLTVLVTYLLIILLLMAITEVHAQPSKQNKPYQIRVMTKERIVRRGYLCGVRDSIILINESLKTNNPFEVKVSEIKTIRLRRKGSVGRGIAIGAGIGALTGYIIGYATYQEPDCDSGNFFCIDFGPEFSGFGGMGAGILIGAGIGALAGGSSKKFEIKGNQNSFELAKPALASYLVVYDPLAEVK